MNARGSVSFAELRRLAGSLSPAWDTRVSEIGRCAVEIAWSARPADVTAENAADYWYSLTTGERSRWFVQAWRVVTGG